MNKEIRGSEVDDILGVTDLKSLAELQKFLVDELGTAGDGGEDFSRAFMPLTDGLGLESPPKQPLAPVLPPTPRISVETLIETKTQRLAEEIEERRHLQEEEEIRPRVAEERKPQGNLEAMFSPREKVQAAPSPTPANIAPLLEQLANDVEPPQLPQASFVRRLLGGTADVFFIVTLWLIAVAITTQSLGNGTEGLLTRLPHELGRPEFLRYALLEYATIWLAYYVITVGITDTTVGMWAWGMRVSSGDEEGRLVKKIFRAIASFLICAPLVTVVLLAFRVKGRNLIDILSGTHVYRTTV